MTTHLVNGIDPDLFDEGCRCAHCGDEWGDHYGMDCMGHGRTTKFVALLGDAPAGKAESLADLLRQVWAGAAIVQPKFIAVDWAAELDPNAAMIARDGVAPKATTVALPTPPLTTAHPAIKGLSFLAAVDHRFGLGR